MKLFVIGISVIFYFTGFSQKVNWLRTHELSDAGFHWGNTVCTDKNSNVYCGSLYKADQQQSNTQTGSYIRKYNKEGSLIWEKFKPLAYFTGIASDSSANIYITGTFFKTLDFGCAQMYDSTQRPMFLAKLDSVGNCLWSKEIKNAYSSKLLVDKSGGAIYVIGGISSYGPQFDCPSPAHQAFQYVSKYDINGNCLWLQPILNGNSIYNIAVNEKYVAVTGRLDFVAYFGIDSSYSIGLPFDPDTLVDNKERINNVYTALYDLNGNLKWAQVTADTSDDVEGNAIALDSENNVYVVGNFYNQVRLAGRVFHVLQWKDIFLVKYNEQGDTVLTNTWPGINSEEGRAIYINKNGVYFAGSCYQQLTIGDTTIYPGIASVVLTKMSFDLKKTEWIKTLGSSGGGHSEIFQITSDSDDNVIACGDYTNDLQVDDIFLTYYNSFYKRPFVISIKELSPVAAMSPEEGLENNEFEIYPNPTGGTFDIRSVNFSDCYIELKLIDVNGQVIYSENTRHFYGEYRRKIDTGQFAKGIYFVEILACEKRAIKKIAIN